MFKSREECNFTVRMENITTFYFLALKNPNMLTFLNTFIFIKFI